MNPAETWPVLAELVNKQPHEQRRLLRMHKDSGLMRKHDADAIEFRARLDEELQRMMVRELRAQTDPDSHEDYRDIPDFSTLLKHSPAFLQYLNNYLYFGVRFAAGRVFDPCSDSALASGNQNCNEFVVALPSPPLCSNDPELESDVAYFLNYVLPQDSVSGAERGLRFLDDFDDAGEPSEGGSDHDAKTCFDLWLRGLLPQPREQASFGPISRGLLRWAESRFEFYCRLEARGPRAGWLAEWRGEQWREGRFHVTNPLIARCALVDFYWLARLLGAEVSPRGLISYSEQSWLHRMAMAESWQKDFRADVSKETLLRWEEVLRAVFGYACEMVQNAVEIAEECADRRNNPNEYPERPATTKPWREVFDIEMKELREQRKQWRSFGPPDGVANRDECKASGTTQGWSRRIWTGETVENLFGIAISGGGIRSATFNLGILQRLQELDLLKHADYLSTVSGGGYIGAWLAGNVRRTRYWLSRLTSWDKSIDHLRRYSNYLAPHNGVFSADTWTMWGTWIRNALLVQLTAFVWLAFLMMLILVLQPAFVAIGDGKKSLHGIGVTVLTISLMLIALILSFYLWRLSRGFKAPPKDGILQWLALKGEGLPKFAAGLSWLAAFITAALLWGQAPEFCDSYREILTLSLGSWDPLVLTAFGVALILISGSQVTLMRAKVTHFVAVVSGLAVSYLALCGLLRIYVEFYDAFNQNGAWLAYVFGPPLAMAAITAAIVVFIGLLGRDAPDWCREWWTRYGSWISMFGAVLLLVSLASVFAPYWVNRLLHLPWRKTAITAPIVGWITSTVGGLLAGKSSRTGSAAEQSKGSLQLIARLGGLIFIVGAVAFASAGVYVILGQTVANNFYDGQLTMAKHFDNLDEIGKAPGKFFPVLGWILIGLFLLGRLFSNRFDLNTFGLNQFYRNRLVRCYLGATRWQPGARRPHLFTGFDDDDDLPLSALTVADQGYCGDIYRGPFPIVNCSLNLGGSSDLALHTRQSASFALTPLYCGSSRQRIGYAPTKDPCGGTQGYAESVKLGQAISVSGAAASPNMGYNTSALVSFLLTMFNVRLGWWFPNPGKSRWNRTGPLSALNLVWELFGMAGEEGTFVNISDGGHFENLGIYELIRRRTRVIIACDGECDSDLTFGSLGNVIRICDTDFGAKIDIDVESIRLNSNSLSKAHCAVGKINYSNGTIGYLIYLKSSITGDEDVGVAQYRSAHPAFPHEPTSDQFFTEDQFEAYRRLGYHVAERAFRGAEKEASDPFEIATKLFDLWVPASCASSAFMLHTKLLDKIWDRFRADRALDQLMDEFVHATPSQTPLTQAERAACLELMQLMENVFLDLRLGDFWDHPDHRGWEMLFMRFARSQKFQAVWEEVHETFGIRFEYFCDRYLGLKRDRPVIRVSE